MGKLVGLFYLAIIAFWLFHGDPLNLRGQLRKASGHETDTPQISAAMSEKGYKCNCNKLCKNLTCEEAYFQYRECSCLERNGDPENDDVPCENVCPGG